MKKNEIIKEAQNFFSLKGDEVQVYPGQDYYLFPKGNQYGIPSSIPFPDRPGLVGVSCAFDLTENVATSSNTLIGANTSLRKNSLLSSGNSLNQFLLYP